MNYLITGTGRCGTHYVADLLNDVGIDATHEGLYTLHVEPREAEAEVSWLAAPFIEDHPDAAVLHLVRHPVRVVASLLRMRFFSDDPPEPFVPYRDYALEHCPEAGSYESETARAVAFVTRWNRMIEATGAVRVRVEDGPFAIFDALDIDAPEVVEEHRGAAHFPGQYRFPEWWTVPPELLADFERMCVDYGYRREVGTPEVYWAVMCERNGATDDRAFDQFLNIAGHNALLGYNRINRRYSATDQARNEVAAYFQDTALPDDTLVTLDADHIHPRDIVERLAAQSVDVVAALCLMRHPPHKPAMFIEAENGELVIPNGWRRNALGKVARAGTGAIAIKARALGGLNQAGYHWPYFRYQYDEGLPYRASEDIYFSQICEQAGVDVYVHTGIFTPHISDDGVLTEDKYPNQFEEEAL